MLNVVLRTVVKLYVQNFDKSMPKLGEKAAISAKKLVKIFFWKRKMQFSRQLWKHFYKSSNKQLKIWIKTFEKEALNRKFFPSKVPLKVLKAVREQWYIFLVESPKFSLKFRKVYEIWFFFQKVLRCYLQSRGALFWQQWRKLVGKKRIIST